LAKAQADCTKIIDTKVQEAIDLLQTVSGLDVDGVSTLKADLLKIWTSLVKEGVYTEQCKYNDVRFQTLQALVEQVLASEVLNFKYIEWMFHGPLSTNPLCMNPDTSSTTQSTYTLQPRTNIVRDYLSKSGRLRVIYSQEGLSQCTAEQQASYQKALAQYPRNIQNKPLKDNHTIAQLNGSTYIFTDSNSRPCAFSIGITPSHERDIVEFALWLAPPFNDTVRERVMSIYQQI
jgi:hypothetical protein